MLPNSYLSRSDAVVEPVGMWLSSQAYASYRPPDYAPAERELSARRSGRLTFGCFNNFAKIKDQVIELWAEILYAAPGARLLRCRSPFLSEDQRTVRKILGALSTEIPIAFWWLGSP